MLKLRSGSRTLSRPGSAQPPPLLAMLGCNPVCSRLEPRQTCLVMHCGRESPCLLPVVPDSEECLQLADYCVSANGTAPYAEIRRNLTTTALGARTAGQLLDLRISSAATLCRRLRRVARLAPRAGKHRAWHRPYPRSRCAATAQGRSRGRLDQHRAVIHQRWHHRLRIDYLEPGPEMLLGAQVHWQVFDLQPLQSQCDAQSVRTAAAEKIVELHMDSFASTGLGWSLQPMKYPPHAT